LLTALTRGRRALLYRQVCVHQRRHRFCDGVRVVPCLSSAMMLNFARIPRLVASTGVMSTVVHCRSDASS
jgi:hypothetical protein